MKRTLLMTGFLSFVSALFSSGSPAADYQVVEVYSGLRNMVFSTKPESLGVTFTQPDEVWGVLMETGYPQAVATLVALADGTVSLYFSNGGGIIGLGPHPGPKQAAQSFLALSQQFSKLATKTTAYPLPKPTYTRFYLLTRTGVVTVEAREEDLGYGRHQFSPLFLKGHDLITEIRKVDEKR
jgi:hypothetical protein